MVQGWKNWQKQGLRWETKLKEVESGWQQERVIRIKSEQAARIHIMTKHAKQGENFRMTII